MSKTVRILIATGALVSMIGVQTPARAVPPKCIKWGWSQCDPHYERFTPEWDACFEAEVAYCESLETGGPIPPPWPFR